MNSPKNPLVANSSPDIRRVITRTIDDNRGAQIGDAIKAVMSELYSLEAPYVTPNEIAPRLGIKSPAFRYYCRECRSARNWQTNYRFFLDDAEHVKVLTDIIRLALWSMKGAAEHLKAKAH